MLVFMSLAYLFSYLYDFTEIPFIFFVSLAFFILAVVFFIIYLICILTGKISHQNPVFRLG